MKVLLVGGAAEEKEMVSMAEGLQETGYKTSILRFQSGKGSKSGPKQLLDAVRKGKVDLVLSRKNFYPGKRKMLEDEIGTTYINEHMIQNGIPVVGCGGKGMRRLRNKSSCEYKLWNELSPYANNFILLRPPSKKHQSVGGKLTKMYGKIINQRGFTEEDLENPFKNWPVLFVKPNALGRSSGITDANVVHNLEELALRSSEIWKEFGNISLIINPFYTGEEFTVGVIGNDERIFLPVRVCQKEGYSINKILLSGVKKGGIPAGRVYIDTVDFDTARDLKSAADNIFNIFNIMECTRADFRRDDGGRLKAIDINGVPGIKKDESYISMAVENAFAGQEAGYSLYGRLVSSIVNSAARRYGLKHSSHPTLFELKNRLLED